MVTFDVQSTHLVPILQITLNKSGWQGLFSGGVLSTFHLIFLFESINSNFELLSRCDARPENLDDKNAHCRSHERSDFIIQSFDPGIVWDEHGIRSDIVVRIFTY